MIDHNPTTGGPIAPAAHMGYDDAGRCVVTVPIGGLSVLDQFAISALGPLIESGMGRIPPDRIVASAWDMAELMLKERSRRVVAGMN